ncbi:hypothetical protein BJX65DRAFT_291197 [Aspergillus insuetus]
MRGDVTFGIDMQREAQEFSPWWVCLVLHNFQRWINQVVHGWRDRWMVIESEVDRTINRTSRSLASVIPYGSPGEVRPLWPRAFHQRKTPSSILTTCDACTLVTVLWYVKTSTYNVRRSPGENQQGSILCKTYLPTLPTQHAARQKWSTQPTRRTARPSGASSTHWRLKLHSADMDMHLVRLGNTELALQEEFNDPHAGCL